MCTACKKPLSGQRFTSRDEFAYCLDCFCDLYAKKCAGCTNPISGECLGHQAAAPPLLASQGRRVRVRPVGLLHGQALQRLRARCRALR